MRFKFILILLLSPFFISFSQATETNELSDGNQIAEPILADYVRAERTPGFSPITDVVDEHGNQFSK